MFVPSLPEVFIVAALAGCATGLGAVPLLVMDRISHRVYDGALGLAAGVMIGASVFALILPGLALGTIPEVAGGIVAGVIALLGLNATLPHLHLEYVGQRREGTAVTDTAYRRAVLVGSSITIHNIPEGLAIGIAFASGEAALALTLAFAIGIQNVPDGFAFAVPTVEAGVSKPRTLVYTTLSGGVPEPIAATIGFTLVVLVSGLFPVAAGFAAGAMIAVVFRELIPASHGHGYADLSTLTFTLGFVLMLLLDVGFAV